MRTRFLLAFLLSVQFLFAQYPPDQALLYTRTGITGTARSVGSGGAYGSVGADLGCIGINPAGLGLYRSSDFSVTPGLKIGSNETVYDLNHTTATFPKFYLGQAGVVWTKILSKPSANSGPSFTSTALRSITVAINYERENFFSRTQNFGAYNTTNSMMDNYKEYLNATRLPLNTSNYPLELNMANSAGLILYDSVRGSYYSNVRAPVQQAGTIESRGGKDKISLAFGMNINDKLYLGMSVNIPFISYQVSNMFSETNPNGSDSSTHFSNYDVTSTWTESGVGFTGSLGIIYRPVTWARFGLAYHLPTWYSMSENYQSVMNVTYDTVAGQLSGGYPSAQKYSLRSPMKGVASASFYYKQFGFLSVDYEFQNLASSRFNFGSDYADVTRTINDSIKADYAYSHTVRAGIEGSIKVLRLRAGYSYTSTPYKKGVAAPGYPEVRQNVTAGLGVRLTHFYADLAYVFGITKDATYIFASDPIYNTYVTHTLLLTVGWKIGAPEPGAPAKKKRYSPPPPPDSGNDKY